MQIAIFNGFNFHCEIFGYIIHYCIIRQHTLTIYCLLDDSNGAFHKNAKIMARCSKYVL